MRFLLFGLAVLAGCTAAVIPASSRPIREGYVSGADRTRLFYRSFGTGTDTLVVVHGFQGNNQNYLAADVMALARDRVVIFYDQRGGGRSSPVDAPEMLGLDAQVRDLEALRHNFGISRMRLFGHSGGAAIAARYALEYPGRVERLILIAPPPPGGGGFGEQTMRTFVARLDSATWARVNALQQSLPLAADPIAVCREITRAVLPRAYFVEATKYRQMRGDFCASPRERVRTQAARSAAFQRSLPQDWRPELPRLGVPVLVIHGDHDAIPLASAEAWVDALPNARLVVVQGADHLPWVEHPQQVVDVINQFLRGTWPGQTESRR